jgi:hypothetical protein
MSRMKLALACIGLIILLCSLCFLLYSNLPYGRATRQYDLSPEDLQKPLPSPASTLSPSSWLFESRWAAMWMWPKGV